jgi:polyisoprenoid-binding protein YceI
MGLPAAVRRPVSGLRAITAALFVCTLVPAAGADTYKLDPQLTEVRFSWDHLGMSRQSGRFTEVEGKVEFDPANPEASRVDVVMKVASIKTGVPALDQALISTKEYFDVASHPAITFNSTNVKMTGEKSALVSGNLMINGIVKGVILDVVWNFTGDHPLANINPTYLGRYSSGFSATTQIRRSDFGITRTIPYVSDEIMITIETEMDRVSG